MGVAAAAAQNGQVYILAEQQHKGIPAEEQGMEIMAALHLMDRHSLAVAVAVAVLLGQMD